MARKPASTSRSSSSSAKAAPAGEDPPAVNAPAAPKRSRKKPAPESAAAPAAPQPPATTQEDRARDLALGAARLLDDDKCTDIVVLDVRQKSQVTDFIVIGTGTSDRQMRSVLHHVEDLGNESGHKAFRSSSDDRATWLLCDFYDVVIHLFEPNTRAHYDLEMMWGDAPRLDFARKPPARKKPAAAEA